MTNISNYGPGHLPPAPGTGLTFIDTDKVYSIVYERYSGGVTRESASNQGGSYTVSSASIFVPRSRSEVDTLMNLTRNRLLYVLAIDRHGNQHVLINALRTFRHSTGTKPGNAHGYQISFTAPQHYMLPSIIGNGEISAAPPVIGGGGGGSSEDCCVSIGHPSISYVPAPSGNDMNRGEFVTTIDGSVYFIDHVGRSILLNRPAARYFPIQIEPGPSPTFITLPVGYPIPDPDDYAAPDYDPQAEIARRLWVFMGSRKLAYDHAEGWYLDVATRRIYFNVSIEEAFIEVYSFQGIPPIIL